MFISTFSKFCTRLLLLTGIFLSHFLFITSAKAIEIFAVDNTNHLLSFDSATPGMINTSLPITGLNPGETILGIDFRPANGQLYALGSTNRLYILDFSTGNATQVGSDGSFTLSGSVFGFDVNPVPDRIRVVSDSEQNLRLNPNNGTLAAADSPLSYVTGDAHFGSNPNIVGSAYTNNFPGSTSTSLYGIDSNLDTLVIQNPPNNGSLNTVGALGVNTSDQVGFDIKTDFVSLTNTAFAALSMGGDSGLYTINLTTGAATFIGQIGGGLTILDIAVAPSEAVQFSSAAYEVIEEEGFATINVVRTGDLSSEWKVNFATSDGTATAGADYTSTSGTLTFAPGENEQSFTIPILDDSLPEGDETVNLTLSNPVGGTLGITTTATLTIGEVSIIRFSNALFSANEKDGVATIQVTRTGDGFGAVSVDFETSDNTATAGADYSSVTQKINFADGDHADKTITIPILNDNIFDGDEDVHLILSNPTGGAILGLPSAAVLTLVDDEQPPPAPPPTNTPTTPEPETPVEDPSTQDPSNTTGSTGETSSSGCSLSKGTHSANPTYLGILFYGITGWCLRRKLHGKLEIRVKASQKL